MPAPFNSNLANYNWRALQSFVNTLDTKRFGAMVLCKDGMIKPTVVMALLQVTASMPTQVAKMCKITFTMLTINTLT